MRLILVQLSPKGAYETGSKLFCLVFDSFEVEMKVETVGIEAEEVVIEEVVMEEVEIEAVEFEQIDMAVESEEVD